MDDVRVQVARFPVSDLAKYRDKLLPDFARDVFSSTAFLHFRDNDGPLTAHLLEQETEQRLQVSSNDIHMLKERFLVVGMPL